MNRGRYAAPVGWMDSRGDGEFAIALRCAQVNGRSVRLMAGCGIVADSDPEIEAREAQIKMIPIRDALEARGTAWTPRPSPTPRPAVRSSIRTCSRSRPVASASQHAHRQGCVPAARREHGVGDAAGDQLVNKDLAQCRRRVHGRHCLAATTSASQGSWANGMVRTTAGTGEHPENVQKCLVALVAHLRAAPPFNLLDRAQHRLLDLVTGRVRLMTLARRSTDPAARRPIRPVPAMSRAGRGPAC